MIEKILSREDAKRIGIKNIDNYTNQEFILDNEKMPTNISYKEPADDWSYIKFKDEEWQYGSYFVTDENLAPPPDFTHWHDLSEDQWRILLFFYNTTLEDALEYFGSNDLSALQNKSPGILAKIHSDNEKMRKTIAEECKTYKDKEDCWTADETIGFYIEGDKVIFKHVIAALDNADCWNAEQTFPIENYKSGVQELIKKGFCSIEGADLSDIGGVGCETLNLRKISDNKIGVYYQGFRGGNIYFKCDINKLVLK